MKKLFCKILFVIDILAFFGFSLCSHFVTIIDSNTGISRDLFGRVQSRAPFYFRYIGIKEWAGLKWLIVDVVVCLVLIIVGALLYELATDKKEK